MDWDGLAGMPPKVLAGYSDVTAALEAVAVRLGWATLDGPMVAIREGTARGITMGGTLCLLASSLGTGTSWPARGGILLLEDVDEEETASTRCSPSCAVPDISTG